MKQHNGNEHRSWVEMGGGVENEWPTDGSVIGCRFNHKLYIKDTESTTQYSRYFSKY